MQEQKEPDEPRTVTQAMHAPLVTIGMPVYNGEGHVALALESLLSQDFRDFELVISDNASTDATQDICLGYASVDHRIKYHRNSTNIGSVNNFNRVFSLASGRYFMWAGHHDLWHPSMLTRFLGILEADRRVVLCFSPVTLIDTQGSPLRVYDDDMDTRGLDAIGRVHVVLYRLRWTTGAASAFYGLIRSDALRATRPYQNVYGPDWIRLVELSFVGSFAKIAEPLMSFRLHVGERTVKEHWESLDPENRQHELAYPFTSMTIGMIKGALHSGVSWWAKPVFIFDIIYCMERKFGLLKELVDVSRFRLGRHFLRERK